MGISEKNLQMGQDAIGVLERALSVLNVTMTANTQCKPLFIRRVPVRGTPEVPERIVLDVPSTQSQALEWGINSLTKTRWDSGQHPKETIRCPGVIIASEKVIAAAREVNEAKALLKRVVDAIPKRQRSELYSSVSRFSSLQALRLIDIVSDVSAITFRWHFTFSTKRKQCSTIKKELLSALSEHIEIEAFEAMLTKQTSNVEMFKTANDFECLTHIPDDEVLAIFRPVQRHIRAYISPHKSLVGGRFVGKGYYIQAKTPILVSESVFINSTDLTCHSTESVVLRDKISVFEEIPVIERLNLFRYIKCKRIYEMPENISKSRMKGGNYLEVRNEG